MALDVADDEADVVVGQRDHVVPVAPHLQARGRRQVAGDGLGAGKPGQPARQQGPLEHADQFVLGVEGVGAQQRLPGEACGGGEQGPLVGGEVVRGVPAEEAGTGQPAAGGQRQHGEPARADLGEGGFEDGAGGPDGDAALAEGGGECRHGADGGVGPLRAPLGAPQGGPGPGFRRVEDGDDEAVALQFGEGEAVGAERDAQRRRDRLADTADGSGGGEGGGEALDPGDVADAGAQGGGVGDGADETGGAGRWAGRVPARLLGGQHPAAHPQPARLPGGLEDAELQFALAQRHVVGLDQGHQGGQVLGDGGGEQGLHPAVEGVPAQAEEVEHGVVDLDAAGVHGEAEGGRARGVPTALGGWSGGRRAGGEGLGDRGQAGSVLGLEALGCLAHGDEAAAVAQRQDAEEEVTEGRQGARVGAAGEVGGGEPPRVAVGVGLGEGRGGGEGIGVAQAVQGAGHADRLGEGEGAVPALALALAHGVEGGGAGTGEDQGLLQGAAQAVVGGEVGGEGLEGKLGPRCPRSAVRGAPLTDHAVITARMGRMCSPCDTYAVSRPCRLRGGGHLRPGGPVPPGGAARRARRVTVREA